MAKAAKTTKQQTTKPEETTPPMVEQQPVEAEQEIKVESEPLPIVEPQPEAAPEPAPVIVEVAPTPKTVMVSDEDLSFEERIENYLRNRSGTIKLNDFLKSLYPIARGNEPPKWMQQASSKYLGSVLADMQAKGKLRVVNNLHLVLGKSYYTYEDQIQQHHNLATTTIEVTL